MSTDNVSSNRRNWKGSNQKDAASWMEPHVGSSSGQQPGQQFKNTESVQRTEQSKEFIDESLGSTKQEDHLSKAMSQSDKNLTEIKHEKTKIGSSSTLSDSNEYADKYGLSEQSEKEGNRDFSRKEKFKFDPLRGKPLLSENNDNIHRGKSEINRDYLGHIEPNSNPIHHNELNQEMAQILEQQAINAKKNMGKNKDRAEYFRTNAKIGNERNGGRHKWDAGKGSGSSFENPGQGSAIDLLGKSQNKSHHGQGEASVRGSHGMKKPTEQSTMMNMSNQNENTRKNKSWDEYGHELEQHSHPNKQIPKQKKGVNSKSAVLSTPYGKTDISEKMSIESLKYQQLEGGVRQHESSDRMGDEKLDRERVNEPVSKSMLSPLATTEEKSIEEEKNERVFAPNATPVDETVSEKSIESRNEKKGQKFSKGGRGKGYPASEQNYLHKDNLQPNERKKLGSKLEEVQSEKINENPIAPKEKGMSVNDFQMESSKVLPANIQSSSSSDQSQQQQGFSDVSASSSSDQSFGKQEENEEKVDEDDVFDLSRFNEHVKNPNQQEGKKKKFKRARGEATEARQKVLEETNQSDMGNEEKVDEEDVFDLSRFNEQSIKPRFNKKSRQRIPLSNEQSSWDIREDKDRTGIELGQGLDQDSGVMEMSEGRQSVETISSDQAKGSDFSRLDQQATSEITGKSNGGGGDFGLKSEQQSSNLSEMQG